ICFRSLNKEEDASGNIGVSNIDNTLKLLYISVSANQNQTCFAHLFLHFGAYNWYVLVPTAGLVSCPSIHCSTPPPLPHSALALILPLNARQLFTPLAPTRCFKSVTRCTFSLWRYGSKIILRYFMVFSR
uniref:Uncharacterized protein n=1 Tax=Astyanax mexicanus TaxID=7994 RepID=A0A3B1IU52_ASTMX